MSAVAAEPCTFRVERHHEFVGRRVKNARCKTCKRGQHFIEHLGYPEPLDSDSGTDPLKWQTQKRAWQESFGEAIHASGLPRGVFESVQVIVNYTFPNRNRRDRDNLVYPLCKFLGDTLVRGRYWTLPYDVIDWLDAGMVDGRKLHRRVLGAESKSYGPTARLVGRTFEINKAVPVLDPLGGWIPDDRWDRFEVIEMTACYAEGVEALDVMLLPSPVVPPGWPPHA